MKRKKEIKMNITRCTYKLKSCFVPITRYEFDFFHHHFHAVYFYAKLKNVYNDDDNNKITYTLYNSKYRAQRTIQKEREKSEELERKFYHSV